ncbi:hypothetical protein [Mucilaginibacter paludis]|uniref:Uncharacterized protein n=1 Tax=Mucilaginibacter paludis DSM 18603 TaxID=714943 RepID=H1Y7B0_9SPHI|nr:hypothetical protein [Mucilaginibacter paludis]EHQ28997.1 hypothetical protein Mucpa_4913 [Mucilaginibacter paludis DSM 18603]
MDKSEKQKRIEKNDASLDQLKHILTDGMDRIRSNQDIQPYFNDLDDTITDLDDQIKLFEASGDNQRRLVAFEILAEVLRVKARLQELLLEKINSKKSKANFLEIIKNIFIKKHN